MNALTPQSRQLIKGAKKNYSLVCFAVLAFYATALVFAYIIVYVGQGCFPRLTESGWFSWMYNDVAMYLFGLPVFWGITAFADKSTPKKIKLPLKKWLLFLVISVSAMYIFAIISDLLTSYISSFTGNDITDTVSDMITKADLLPTVLAVVVIAPIFEELMFRKILLDRVAMYDERRAVLLSGLCFGLMHGNLSQVLYAFVLGMIFAYVYLRTGNVIYTILLHAAVNFIGSILPLLLEDSLTEILDSSGQNYFNSIPDLILTQIYSILLIAAVIAGIVLFIIFVGKRKYHAGQRQLPRKHRSAGFAGAGVIIYIIFFTLIIIGNIFPTGSLQ